MILKDFVILLANTSRSKAYLQLMVKNEVVPEKCIVFVENKEDFIKEECDFQDNTSAKYFSLEEPLKYTLTKSNINYIIVENKDVNSNTILECLKECKEKYVIYSGYGGYILKKHLFDIGKKFIHIHAGILPEYRGSTTAYYSIINEGVLGATAIFLDENIDSGNILLAKRFPMPPDDINIDHIYEPYIRAEVLVELLKKYVANQGFSLTNQHNENAETYYIIHPVLKHIALLKVSKNRKE